MRRRMVVLSAVIGIAIGGCGSGGADTKPYVDALVQSGARAGGAFKPTPAQLRCQAQHVVGIIGVDTLKRSGLTPQKIAATADALTPVERSLPRAKAKKLVDFLLSGKCISPVDESAAALKTRVPDDAKARCITEAIIHLDAYRSFLVDQAMGKKSPNPLTDAATMRPVAKKCGVDRSVLGF